MCEILNIDVPAVLVLPHSTHNFSIVPQGAIYVTGAVNAVATAILVDAGSAVTILHKDLWEQSARSISGALEAISSPVTVVNGQPLHILGLGTVRICITDIQFVHQALIADDVSQSCWEQTSLSPMEL